MDIRPEQVPRKKSIKTSYYQYGSILGDYRGELKRICNLENKAIVSATASRNSIDAYNIIVLKEFKKNDAVNPFPVGTSYAIAHYRDQINQMRRAKMIPAA